MMDVLKKDKRLWDGNTLNKTLLFELLENYDKELFEILLSDSDIEKKYFVKVGNSYLFKYEDFRFFIEQNKLGASFTKYKNIIGLSNKGKYLSENTDYVLEWPYKDTVLQGGMSSEEDEDTYIDKKDFSRKTTLRQEIFFNNIISVEEIDKLRDKKALKNFKRFTSKGEEQIIDIKRDSKGIISENMLIKGNNLLALHCLEEQFSEKVKLIYIDPPYNTGGDADIFTYNNKYPHSTWLTFMKNRLDIAIKLLREDGVLALTIDHFELFYVGVLLDEIFGRENRIGIVSIVHKPEGRQFSKYFSPSNEYMLVYAKNIEHAKMNEVLLDDEKNKEYDRSDFLGNYKLQNFLRTGGGDVSLRKNKPEGWYPIYVSKDGKSIQLDYKKEFIKVLPITKSGQERTWTASSKTFQKYLSGGEIIAEKDSDNNMQIYRIARPKEIIKTHWVLPKYHAIHHGTNLLAKIVGKNKFSYPKSLYAVSDVVKLFTEENDIVLDFFSGSATTGHAVMFEESVKKLNRQFILIEQVDNQVEVGKERLSKLIKDKSIEKVPSGFNDIDFIYFELAEYNQEAKNKIDRCKSFKELKKLFLELTNYYFLHYNVSIKKFNEEVLDTDDFKKLDLNEQKIIFNALLDNNQLYISYDEQDDPRFNLLEEDKKLTVKFYE